MMKEIIAAFALLSVLAFVLYGLDKRAAIKGRRRVPERTLHLIDLAGGWPGALLARQLFRHKTSKPGFVLIFWLTVFANLTAVAAWASR